jgi:hypothetical protein
MSDDELDREGEEEEEIEVTQEEKDASLLEAAKIGDVKDMKRWVKDGASVTVTAADGWTPLVWAACNGYTDAVQYLLEQGAGQQYVKRSSATTDPPPAASKKMDLKNTVNSPLHWAAFKGHLAVVWILLKAKLSPYDVDSCGNNAVHLASTGGSADVLKCLMSEGFDLTLRNWYGNTALDLADKPETRELLLRASREKVCYSSGKGFSAAVLRYYCTHSGHFFCEEETVSDQVTVAVGRPDTKPVRYSKESLRILMSIEKQLTDACKGKLDKSHLSSLEAAVNTAESNGCNVLLVHKGSRTLARLVAECNLRDEMERLESIRPLKKRGDVKGLIKLIKIGRKEGVREEDGMEEADGMLMALEAEVTLSSAFSLFDGVECGLPMHHKELHKLDSAVEEAEACGSHPELLKTVKAVQSRLHAETDLTHVMAAPHEECIVDEEGEPTEFIKYTLWDGQTFDTSKGGSRLAMWEFRYNFLASSIEKGTESECFPSLLESAVQLETEWAGRLKEEQQLEEDRIAAEEAAAAKAAKKKKKKK